jgi:hypothetical protein
MMMAGRGDELPVSALPVDGTFPSATTQWEKRNISGLRAGLGTRNLHPVRQLQLSSARTASSAVQVL